MKNDLEFLINLLIEKINQNNLGLGWKNEVTKTHTGKYLEGEKFDYIIITKKKILCFDAKEIKIGNWGIAKKDIKQAYNLLSCSINKNVDSFFLIYFHSEKNYGKLDIHEFFKILNKRKHVKPCDTDMTWRLENDIT